MSRSIAWIALAIFPLVQLLIINPVRFSWGFHRGAEAMPAELTERANKIDRFLLFPKSILIVAFIAVLLTHEPIPAAQLGLHLDEWRLNVLLGLSTSLLRIGVQWMSLKWLISKKQEFEDRLLRGAQRWLGFSRSFSARLPKNSGLPCLWSP